MDLRYGSQSTMTLLEIVLKPISNWTASEMRRVEEACGVESGDFVGSSPKVIRAIMSKYGITATKLSAKGRRTTQDTNKKSKTTPSTDHTPLFEQYQLILNHFSTRGFRCHSSHRPRHTEKQKEACAAMSAFKITIYTSRQ